MPPDGADGVIINLGGHGGGWSFYLKQSTPAFCYNLFGIEQAYVCGERSAPAGHHRLGMHFAYDGEGLGKGGEVILDLGGDTIGSGRIERTEPIGFGYEYTDIGRDALSPVTDDYTPGDSAFTGTINWVQLEAGDDSHDHLVDPAEFWRVAMWKQ